MDPIKLSKEIHNDIINWRRELHKIPGTGLDIEETYNFVCNELTKMNIEFITLSKTGICALINGENPGPTIAIRADMDGLPIKEETGLKFASNNNCMHACGHDAHTSMLLGTAKILSKYKSILKGNVKLIFQPAEEISAGAEPMIAEGVLDNPKVDRVLGLHIGGFFPEVKAGMIGVRTGYTTSAVDKLSVTINGKGGHGALPHLCVDPISIGAEMISALQRIVSREINPLHPVVITIGSIEGGSTWNIIPESVHFQGTIRTIFPEDRELVEKRVIEICNGIASTNGASADVVYDKICPSVNNNSEVTKSFMKSALKIVGEENLVYLKEPTMVSEDMAYYLQNVPGTFFFLGSNNPKKGIIYPHHHPKFDVDEDVLWIGPAIFVQAVLDYNSNL
ncbi:M20 metallopeptidase family protein [Clostridium paridis]|uniref:Amidohydrolase n=1 Tax=Clostridium paridis TaxID=2803863 RepID=A0A937FH35_9CLOT|nr:M20 family metallopeptidase [Clostridium paridis]MBL4931311.1 amidohydrolase [Clostridium paridis]